MVFVSLKIFFCCFLVLMKSECWVFNVTGTIFDTDILRRCVEEHLSCLSSISPEVCYCDALCVAYNDCCYDATEVRVPKEWGKYPLLSSCVHIGISDFEKHPRDIMMVIQCPQTWEDINIRKRCESNTSDTILDIIPVTDDASSLTFRNRHCAICNGFTDWKAWELNINAIRYTIPTNNFSFTQWITKCINSGDCQYNFQPPFLHLLRPCFSSFSYQVGTAENKTACNSNPFTPVFMTVMTRTMYIAARNIECAKQEFEKVDKSEPIITSCIYEFLSGRSTSWSLSNLLDFSALLHRANDSYTCRETEIYFSDIDECLLLYCPYGFHPYFGECLVKPLNTVKGIVLDLLLETNSTVKTAVYFEIEEHLINIGSNLIQTVPLAVIRSHIRKNSKLDVIIGRNDVTESNCSFVHILMPLPSDSKINTTEKGFINSLKGLLNNFTTVIEGNKTIHFIDDVTNSKCKTNSSSLHNPKYFTDPLFSAYERNISCPSVKVIKGSITNSSDQMYYIALSTLPFRKPTIDKKHVTRDVNEYFVCVDMYKTLSKTHIPYSKYSQVRKITSMVCTFISILSLIVLLFQYINKILETRKSVPFMLLVVTLTAFQIQFVLTTELSPYLNIITCYWLAILNHVIGISTFTFMFTSLISLYLNLKTLIHDSSINYCVTVSKYTFIGLVPSVFVVVCTVLTNTWLSPDKSWYTENGVCFITNALVLLLAFVTPVTLLILGNIVVFILITLVIYSTTSKTSSSRTSRNNVLIYLRISTVLGVTWLLGIINVFVQSDVLSMIFEVTTHLQGFFIMLAFVCNKRVLEAYVQRLGKNDLVLKTKTSS